MAFYNLARMYTTTTGTGTMTLTTAVPGCLTFALAGVSNGEAVNYAVITYDLVTHRPTHTETGVGTYTTAGLTMSRTTVEKSTNSDGKIVLTGLSEVYCAPLASDFNAFITSAGISYAVVTAAGAETVTNTNSALIDLDTETVDANSIVTLSSGRIVFTNTGHYFVSAMVNLYTTDTSTPFNGNITVSFDQDGYDPVAVKTYATADGVLIDDVTMSNFFAKSATNTLGIIVDNQSGTSVDVSFDSVTIMRLL